MRDQAMSHRWSGRVESDSAEHLVRRGSHRTSNNDYQAEATGLARVPAARAEAIIDSLVDREIAIVSDVGRLRLMSGAQLRRLHFDPSISGQRHGRRVLTSLTNRRVLARLPRSIGGKRSGSAGYVYTLDLVGQRLLNPATDVRRPWIPSEPFVKHAAMVSECYTQLVEATGEGRLELLGFDGEPTCWRTFIGRRGTRRTLKPDGFIRLGLGQYEDRWFLECDRSTEDIPRILRKCHTYGQYWLTGKEAVYPRVLWVANRAGRAAALTRALDELPKEHQQLFAVCETHDFVTTVIGGADSQSTRNR